MRRARTLLCLLALPLLAGATTPEEPALKEILRLSVRGDSGGAQRFTVVKHGIHVFSQRRQALEAGGMAPDTLMVAGVGIVELVSADPDKPLIIDAWTTIGVESSPPQRYSARSVKIEKATPMSGYVITQR